MFATKFIKNLKPYSIVSHKAWELAEKNDVLKLDWNEATIPPSPKVKDRLSQFLLNGNLNWYPDVKNSVLLNEISSYAKISKENLQYFASSDAAHEYIVRTFLEPKDKVIIVSPTYDNFRSVAEGNGAIVEYYNLNQNFELDIESFVDFINFHKPKIVYICNPNNPTGTIHSLGLISELLSKFKEVLFIVDEAYFEFVGCTCKDLVSIYENLIISRTFSKAFGLASFRIGYALSCSKNIELLSKIRNPKSVSTFAQIASIAALEDIGYMNNYVAQVLKAKEFFREELKILGFEVFGKGGNFLLIKLKQDEKIKLIEFLETRKIFVRNYSHVPSMEDYFRITIGNQDQMQEVLRVIKLFKNV